VRPSALQWTVFSGQPDFEPPWVVSDADPRRYRVLWCSQRYERNERCKTLPDEPEALRTFPSRQDKSQPIYDPRPVL